MHFYSKVWFERKYVSFFIAVIVFIITVFVIFIITVIATIVIIFSDTSKYFIVEFSGLASEVATKLSKRESR